MPGHVEYGRYSTVHGKGKGFLLLRDSSVDGEGEGRSRNGCKVMWWSLIVQRVYQGCWRPRRQRSSYVQERQEKIIEGMYLTWAVKVK